MRNSTLLILFILFIQVTSIFANSHNPVKTDTIIAIKSNVLYKVNQDRHNIFISVETDDIKISQTILREGVTVYFDSKGKKKRKVYVQYPKEVKEPNNKRIPPPQNNREKEQPNRKEIIDNMPQEATYVHLDTKREFHTLINDIDISLSIDLLKHDRIKYNLRIPKDKVKTDQRKDLSKLSLGVLIGRNKTERSEGQQGGRGPSNGQGGGPPSGGRRGRHSGGGQGGGPSGGGQRSPQGNNSQTQTQIFWFKAELNNH